MSDWIYPRPLLQLEHCSESSANNKNACSRKVRESALVWSGLMSYLISLDPLLFKNIAYVGSFKHFVFVFVFVITV